jgi:hypothetical protein
VKGKNGEGKGQQKGSKGRGGKQAKGKGRGNRKGVKEGEGNKQRGREGARRGAVQPHQFLDRVDAYKPVSTAKLMAQKPICNLKLRHKNSVFSVPIIVTTSTIYNGICAFLTVLL